MDPDDPDALADADDPDNALRRSEPGEPPSFSFEAMVRKSTGAASISFVSRLCRETEDRRMVGEPQLNDHNASLSGGVSSSLYRVSAPVVEAQFAASF